MAIVAMMAGLNSRLVAQAETDYRAPDASAVLPVWAGVAPGSEGQTGAEHWEERGKNGVLDRAVSVVHRPALTVYLPPQGTATGVGILIAPGGGYEKVVIDKEGYAVARWCAAHGIVGVVLKYRLAATKDAHYTPNTALLDARQALKDVRAHAAEWGIAPGKLGMAGFSAGGNLTARAGTQLPVAERPAFLVLMYASVPKDFGPVPADTPPTFIAQADDDQIGVENSVRFYEAARANHLSPELHLFVHGKHGFGLGTGKGPVEEWPGLFLRWLISAGFLPS